MLDGTGDVISELWEPKKGRLLDIDYMISIMIMRKSEQQHCIKDLTGVPGFVYLLDNGRASFVMEKGAELYISGTLAKAHFLDKVKPQGKKQDISVIKEANEASCRTYLSLEKGKKQLEQHTVNKGKGLSLQTQIDNVMAIGCTGWPRIAERWAYRRRYWPPDDVIFQCKSKGYHLIPKAHVGGDPDIEWRYSFSLAETRLLEALTDKQWKCFYILKHLIHKQFGEFHSFSKALSTYHVKTVIFWACETKPLPLWDLNTGSCILGLLDDLIHAYTSAQLPHYFIPECNILVNVNRNTAQSLICLLHQLRRRMSNDVKDPVIKVNSFYEPQFWNYQSMRYNNSLGIQSLLFIDSVNNSNLTLLSLLKSSATKILRVLGSLCHLAYIFKNTRRCYLYLRIAQAAFCVSKNYFLRFFMAAIAPGIEHLSEFYLPPEVDLTMVSSCLEEEELFDLLPKTAFPILEDAKLIVRNIQTALFWMEAEINWNSDLCKIYRHITSNPDSKDLEAEDKLPEYFEYLQECREMYEKCGSRSTEFPNEDICLIWNIIKLDLEYIPSKMSALDNSVVDFDLETFTKSLLKLLDVGFSFNLETEEQEEVEPDFSDEVLFWVNMASFYDLETLYDHRFSIMAACFNHHPSDRSNTMPNVVHFCKDCESSNTMEQFPNYKHHIIDVLEYVVYYFERWKSHREPKCVLPYPLHVCPKNRDIFVCLQGTCVSLLNSSAILAAIKVVPRIYWKSV